MVVSDHGKAVARIVPLDRPGLLEQLVAEGMVTPHKRQHSCHGPDPIGLTPRNRRPSRVNRTL